MLEMEEVDWSWIDERFFCNVHDGDALLTIQLVLGFIIIDLEMSSMPGALPIVIALRSILRKDRRVCHHFRRLLGFLALHNLFY